MCANQRRMNDLPTVIIRVARNIFLELIYRRDLTIIVLQPLYLHTEHLLIVQVQLTLAVRRQVAFGA